MSDDTKRERCAWPMETGKPCGQPETAQRHAETRPSDPRTAHVWHPFSPPVAPPVEAPAAPKNTERAAPEFWNAGYRRAVADLAARLAEPEPRVCKRCGCEEQGDERETYCIPPDGPHVYPPAAPPVELADFCEMAGSHEDCVALEGGCSCRCHAAPPVNTELDRLRRMNDLCAANHRNARIQHCHSCEGKCDGVLVYAQCAAPTPAPTPEPSEEAYLEAVALDVTDAVQLFDNKRAAAILRELIDDARRRR